MIYVTGVRYGKPPVGELRFQKPEPADPWTGVELAQKGKAVCLHYAAVPVGKGEPTTWQQVLHCVQRHALWSIVTQWPWNAAKAEISCRKLK